MVDKFDPKKSYLAMKAHENMIAFIGFRYRWGPGETKEGVVKITASELAYGRGNVTLTFIVDTAGEDILKDRLQEAFSSLTEADFVPLLGKSLQQVVKVSLDSLAGMRDWYIQEVNIRLSAVQERQSVLIEELLLPALDRALDFEFEAVQWWPRQRTPVPPGVEEIEAHSSPKSLFMRWFGVD